VSVADDWEADIARLRREAKARPKTKHASRMFEQTFGDGAESWWRLPVELKQRWWEETDYGARQPSTALKAVIRLAIVL
jgi:hypothetical protein